MRRGDELGPGGKIIRKREDVLREYYESNVEATQFEEPISKEKPVAQTEPAPATEVEEPKKTSSTKTKPGKTKAESKEEDDWVEDADGNFVKREA